MAVLCWTVPAFGRVDYNVTDNAGVMTISYTVSSGANPSGIALRLNVDAVQGSNDVTSTGSSGYVINSASDVSGLSNGIGQGSLTLYPFAPIAVKSRLFFDSLMVFMEAARIIIACMDTFHTFFNLAALSKLKERRSLRISDRGIRISLANKLASFSTASNADEWCMIACPIS